VDDETFIRLMSTERSLGAAFDQTPGPALVDESPNALQVDPRGLRSVLTPNPPRPQSAAPACGARAAPSVHVEVWPPHCGSETAADDHWFWSRDDAKMSPEAEKERDASLAKTSPTGREPMP